MSRPAQVIRVADDGATAVVESADARREVSLIVLTHEGVGVVPGDWLLLGAGLAVARIEEDEARAMLDLLEEATTQ